MTTIAAFQPDPADTIDPAWDVVVEVLEYDPYGRGSSEVTYLDALGREHRTSTKYIRLFTGKE